MAYANDAMNGLDLANQIDGSRSARGSSASQLDAETARMLKAVAARPAAERGPVEDRPRGAPGCRDSAPPDLRLHVMRDYDLDEIFRYINPVMLYTRHLGLRNSEQALAAATPRRCELRAAIAAVEEVMLARDGYQGQRRLQILSRPLRRRPHVMIYSSDGKTGAGELHLRPPERRARAVPGRLRRAALIGTRRLPVHVRDHDRPGRARAGR